MNDNLLLVLHLPELNLLANHRINLDPFQELRIDLTHYMPEKKKHKFYLVINRKH